MDEDLEVENQVLKTDRQQDPKQGLSPELAIQPLPLLIQYLILNCYDEAP